jgi:catechol 2,3-dioxygenase-like lactoylglutathione lyase family enzyme
MGERTLSLLTQKEISMAETHTDLKNGPLSLNFLSHGTIETIDSDKSRKFYEEFLGFDVIRTSPISLLLRMGGNNTMAVVEVKKKPPMGMLNHNGLDVRTKADVDTAHAKAVAQQDKWGIKKITRPLDQHGTYCFFINDPDDNWWEILTNPEGGYAWMFERGDQEGRGHLEKDFERPKETL